MIERLKFLLASIVFVGLLILAFEMGQRSRPILSYESTYKTLQSLKEDISESFDISTSENLIYSYIPAYSHIYVSEGEAMEMALTLSLRNTDMKNSIKIKKILYFDTDGKLIRQYLKEEQTLAALETKEVFVKRSDIEGGSGANFVVIYEADRLTLDPIFETIMATEVRGKSYVFNSRGKIFSQKEKM